jgi:LuxR family maltose regulon positive regulatory protein
VPRPRLIDQLDEGLHLGRRLTLISAPAGFGKTTLISAWLGQAGRPIAWLSVDEGDNDPVQFLYYLVAALQQVDEGIGRTVTPLLQSPQPSPPQSLATALINDISASTKGLILVLDDYQFITSPAIHPIVGFLLENQPPEVHTVISTREDPPFALARMRARGQVTEIRERDLRFTLEETAAFLSRTMGLALSPDAVAALEARTEGWITGLQLAGLALQKDQEDADAFIAAFTGSDRYIMDYLMAEVLEREPESVRSFLRQTALLDRLTAPLCDAVTGREDSRAILEHLEGANLFLIPLDHRREWYRYHRLFAEVLRLTIPQAQRGALHQRAVHWYEAHGFVKQAIQHALAYARATGDLDDAERLISQAATATMHSGAVMTVHGWLDALPDGRVRANPALAIGKGWVLAVTGAMAQAEDYANAAEAALQVAEPSRHVGELLLLRCFIALLGHQDYPKAIELASSALESLPEDDRYWRVVALWAMAEAQERTGHIADAIRAFRDAQRIGQTLGDQAFTVTVDMALAAALNSHGKRDEAIRVCEEAIARYTDDQGRVAPLAGLVCSVLGTLQYEANQLDVARQYHDQGLALFGKQFASTGYLMATYGFRAQTLYAQGEVDAALESLQTAYQMDTGLTDPGWVLAREATIRLKQGDLPAVLRWVETDGLSLDEAPQYLRLDSQLAYARVLLALGQLADAQGWLARLEGFVEERGLYRWLISVYALQALAAERLGDHEAACDRLAQAVRLAAPEAYYRAFLDEDALLLELLPDVRHVAPQFVDQLLDYARGASVARRRVPQPLVEPVSERELEVLGLIAAGYSNAEIAQRLFITLGTVKRHINNLYGKLGVQSRTQAVAKGRELRLLDIDA